MIKLRLSEFDSEKQKRFKIREYNRGIKRARVAIIKQIKKCSVEKLDDVVCALVKDVVIG